MTKISDERLTELLRWSERDDGKWTLSNQEVLSLATELAAFRSMNPRERIITEVRNAYECASLLAEGQSREGRGNSYYTDGWYGCAQMVADIIQSEGYRVVEALEQEKERAE